MHYHAYRLPDGATSSVARPGVDDSGELLVARNLRTFPPTRSASSGHCQHLGPLNLPVSRDLGVRQLLEGSPVAPRSSSTMPPTPSPNLETRH